MDTTTKFSIAIHGGCGVITKALMNPDLEQQISTALNEAIQKGIKILEAGGSSLDAVQAAVVVLEDCPLFNAGKGSVYTHDERHELDASIMNGKDLKAGSVCATQRTKNPIKLARAVMDQTQHVLLCGQGADQLAQDLGLEIVEPSYFGTEFRLKQLHHLQSQGKNKVSLDHTAEVMEIKNQIKPTIGTVGAVAKDQYGNLAAATSTGGMNNKLYGRVSDSCIIGSGNYANNETLAISCTGTGEYFQRSVTGFDASALMEYKNLSLNDACKVVLEKLEKIGGDGGLIAVDKFGNIALPCTTEGMYRAQFQQGGQVKIELYND